MNMKSKIIINDDKIYFNKLLSMKKLILGLFIFITSLSVFAYAESIATLNSSMTVNQSLILSNLDSYRQTCIDETLNDDNLFGAYYVDDNIRPDFYYTYSNTNNSKVRGILDWSEILVYNPWTFVSNWQFSFLSNINPNLNPTITVYVTQMLNPVRIIWNSVWRANTAWMYILHWRYQTYTSAGSNSSNNYGYKTSLSQTNQTYYNKNLIYPEAAVDRYSCVKYFVAKCWDGVQDNESKNWNANTNGKNWILVNWKIIPWEATPPEEECDWTDGVPSWYTCNSSCQLVQINKSCLSIRYDFHLTGWVTNTVIVPPSSSPTTNEWNDVTITCNTSNFTKTPYVVFWQSGNMFAQNVASPANFYNLQPWSYQVRCVEGLGWAEIGGYCNGQINVNHLSPTLNINKYLLNNILYRSGDLVWFKVDFSNSWSWTAHAVIFEDILPLWLDYVSHTTVGIPSPSYFSVHFQGWHRLVTYTWFNLNPWQGGYMIITWRYNWNPLDRTNRSTIQSTENPIIYSNAIFNIYSPTTNLSIIKNINKSIFYLWENLGFTIAVTNNWPDVADTVQIQDLWPNISCIIPLWSRTSNMPLTFTNTSNPYTWMLNGPLAVGQTIYLYLSWVVANNTSCIGNYLNTWTLTYTINWQTKYWQDYKPFVVIGTPIVNVDFVKTLIQWWNKKWDAISFLLTYQNKGSVRLDSFDIVDYRPWLLNFTSASIMPNVQIPTANWQELRRFFNYPLLPWQWWTITLYGTIK